MSEYNSPCYGMMDEETDRLRSRYQIVINDLIEEIKNQNCEIVALRSLLTRYMNPENREYMKAEIYYGLYPQYPTAAYEAYVNEECGGADPFDEKRYEKELKAYAHGRITEIHPNICMDAFHR